jgi:NDP-sugar pyrophosphorylase family protein
MPEISLLVLAAGIGKRYKGLKQLDSIGPGGETLLDYSLYGAFREGFRKAVFVIRRQMQEAFRQAIGQRWEKHLEVRYVFQEIDSGLPEGFEIPEGRKKPWGTGHALLVSREAISTPFAVINADDFYGPEGLREMAGWLRASHPHDHLLEEYCFLGYRLRNTLSEHGFVSRGVCRVGRDGFLKEVVERTRIEKEGEGARALDDKGRWIRFSGDEVVSMNFWGFTPSVFAHLEKGFAAFLDRSGRDPEAEYYIPQAVNELLRSGIIRVKHIPTRDRWFGLTYPEDLPRVRSKVREMIREGLYPERIHGEDGLE